MSEARPRLFFDYVDPGSWLMDLRATRVSADAGVTLERVPFEVRPPPEPLLDPDDPAWSAYWASVAGELEAEGLGVRRPSIVPWTRKAHELRLHAHEKGADEVVHAALFRRFHLGGEDIGRVDVLMKVAAAADLGYTETRAVLDVDRHAEAIDLERVHALEIGVRGVPTLAIGERILEGIHDLEAIRAFVGADGEGDRT